MIGYFFGYAVDEIRRSFHVAFLVVMSVLGAAAIGYVAYRFMKRGQHGGRRLYA